MSARLWMAALGAGPRTLRRELQRVADETVSALDELLIEVAESNAGEPRAAFRLQGSLAQRRASMAAAHEERIGRLVELIGRAQGIERARRVLFEAGLRLGRDARHRLSLKRTRRDLSRAARLLYRILGIRLCMEWTQSGEGRVRIDRCALAGEYTRDTCLALSAADAGVVAGLWPGAQLEFQTRLTEGAEACVARLWLPLQAGSDEP